MSSIEDILISAQAGSQECRLEAMRLLTHELHTNPGNLLSVLSQILSSQSKPLLPRQLAGFYIKNAINNTTNDPQIINLWAFIPGAIKHSTKNAILAVLADENRELRQISAQIIAGICKFDLPAGQWPEVLKVLLMNSMNMNPVYKEAAIMTLGYICENIPEGVFTKEQSDSILTALFSGLADEEKNLTVIKTALNGMRNSLKFLSANFVNSEERKVLLAILYKHCANLRVEVRKLAMEVLCDIALMYYECLADNLMDLGNLTYNAINNDDITVGILAIEFWNILGEAEIERIESNRPHMNYLTTAAATLTPILLSKIHISDENEDEFDMQKAASICLTTLAYIIKDPIVDYTYTYISNNLPSPNPQLMKAAALVFGSILGGPSAESLSHLVKSSMKTLQLMLMTQNSDVRRTVAWCFANIIGNFKEIYQFGSIKDLLASIKFMISDETKIACHGCASLERLASYKEFSQTVSREDVIEFFNLVSGLLQKQDNQDLSIIATLSLKAVIINSTKECVPFFSNKISLFVGIIQGTPMLIKFRVVNILEALFGRMKSVQINENLADEVFTTILTIVKSNSAAYVDCVDAIGTFIWVMSSRFEKYIQTFIPLLLWGLEDLRASNTCKSAIICIGDLARTLSVKFSQYIPHFIQKFSEILANETVDIYLKIETIYTIGDICLIPEAFSKHMQGMLQYIDSAAGICKKQIVEDENPDLFEAINTLRESILCFYSSLLNGLAENKSAHLLIGNMERMVELCIVLNQDYYNPSQSVQVTALGLLQDIVINFKESCSYIMKSEPVIGLLKNLKLNHSGRLKDAANTTLVRVNQL